MAKTKTDHAKTIAKFIVGTSVGFTTGNIIKHNTSTTKRRHKAEAYVGAVVIGTMASEVAEDWTDKKIDQIVAAWSEATAQLKN